MAQPITWTGLIVPNGGIDETQSPQKIAVNKWAAAENIEPLPDGVRDRLGSTQQTTTQVTGAGTVTAIADYRLSDGTTSRHLAYGGGELYKNVAGVLTQVSTITETVDGTILPSHAVGNDKFYITNNTEVSKKFYVLGGTEYYGNEGISPPTNVPALAVSGSGQNLNVGDGNYEIDYYYWNDDTGVASDRKYNGVSAPTINVPADEQIDITNLPTAVARAGDIATHIRIETREPSSTIFRLVKEISLADLVTSGGVAAITDADLPTTVEAEYDHAVPPVHKIKLFAEGRQFILNVADFPYRMMFSARIGTTSHYESFPANNYRDFGKGGGDYGTALAFLPPRTVIVGFRNSIYAIDARRPATADPITIAENIGIANHHSLIVVGRRLYFISDAEENKGPFVWNGQGEPQPIFGIDDTFKALNQARLDKVSCVHYAPGDNRFQWWILCSSAAATQHDTILVYDYALSAWAVYKKPVGRLLSVLSTVEESGRAKVYGGGYDGNEYLQDGGTTDAGTAYIRSLTLKAFDFEAENIIKQMRWVDFLVDTQTTGAINLSVERDYGQRSVLSRSLQHMVTGTTFTLGTSLLGGDHIMGGGGEILSRASLRGRARVFQPTLSSTGAFRLRGLSFGAQPTRKM